MRIRHRSIAGDQIRVNIQTRSLCCVLSAIGLVFHAVRVATRYFATAKTHLAISAHVLRLLNVIESRNNQNSNRKPDKALRVSHRREMA